MIEFKLLTKRYPVKINEKLLKFISNRQLDEVDINREAKEGLQSFIISCKEEKQEEVREILAMVISDLVQEIMIEDTMDELLRNSQTLIEQEKEAIKEAFITNHYVSKEEGDSYTSYYMVYIPILKEIETHSQLHLEGWIRFRTKKYKLFLMNLLEVAIEDYEKQRDYLEYIQFIVESRRGTPLCRNCLQLFPEVDGGISILNEDGMDITAYYIDRYCQEFLEEVEDEVVTQEDLILNILITVPPKKLEIHSKDKFQNQPFLKTIQIIFGESILYCNECELCKNRKNL